MDKDSDFHYTPALIAKERQLLNTLRALECMLETIQELRTKVNFERTQLITLIEMATLKDRSDQPVPIQPYQIEKLDDSSNEAPNDPLVLLDKMYNGAFCVSEEEEEEEDDDDLDDDIFTRGDNFGTDNDVQW